MTAPNNARERGILFSAPMVLTLLADKKTQTRRAVKPQPSPHSGRSGIEVWHRRPRPGLLLHPVTSEMAQYCPYGQPGDRLWVRETWRASLAYDLSPPRDIPLDSPILYEAGDGTLPSANAGRKRPGMFMPRWATRICWTSRRCASSACRKSARQTRVRKGWAGLMPMHDRIRSTRIKRSGTRSTAMARGM
jgi:hypothetical protein